LTILSGYIGLVAYVGALAAVEGNRRGEWLGWLELACQRIADALPRRGKPFASKRQAQFWMEWHRRGWLLAGALGILMASALVLFPLSTALYFESPAIQISFFTLPITTLWFATCAGMHLA